MRNIRIALVCCFALMSLSVVACSSHSSQEPSARGETGRTAAALSLCDHDVCGVGGPLSADCDACPTNLCALDPYCCSTAWDATCVGEVTSICGTSCNAPPPAADGGEGGESTCAHAVCASGGPLISGCEPCSAQLCAQDPYCCTTAWDTTCVSEVASICGTTCN